MSKPFSVLDGLEGLWPQMIRVNTALQAKNDPLAQRSAAPVRLRGTNPISSAVAGAVNTITSGPNTSAPLDVGGVRGLVRRGNGRDLIATGRVPRFPGSIRATGQLDPANGRDIGISDIRESIRFVTLPSQVRLYNTPDGRLHARTTGDLEIGVGPAKVRVRQGDHTL